MTTREMIDVLLARHPAPEWVGYREAWAIDVFAMRCWSGGIGRRRIAYEVKVSRGDWRTELRKPWKRERAMQLAHQFVFACPEGLIAPEEVPEGCGLVYVRETKTPTGLFQERVVPVVRAPITEARPYTEDEIVYLARYQWYRERIEAERIELARLREQVKALSSLDVASQVA